MLSDLVFHLKIYKRLHLVFSGWQYMSCSISIVRAVYHPVLSVANIRIEKNKMAKGKPNLTNSCPEQGV